MLCCLSICFTGLSATAASLRIEIEHLHPKSPINVTRTDYLLSELSLQRENGSWLATEDWYELISTGKERVSTRLTGVSRERFKSIRFSIGLPPAINASEPQQYPADHPLNPQLNGLHWGWKGGYVFLALEGQHTGKASFSYHLANDQHRMWIELPIRLDTSLHSTVRLRFDLRKILTAELIASQTSTHSRDGDKLAPKLVSQIEQAFTVVELSSDRFQDLPAASINSVRITERFPEARLPADNPLTKQGIALGKALFFETKLSAGSKQSCSSCHNPKAAFSDSTPTSLGSEGKPGSRNSMPLFNLAWHESFFWDGRASSLREQVLIPIQDPLEMNETLPNVIAKLSTERVYLEQFRDVFGDSKITPERIGLALEQFLLSLISQDAKFDRAARGEVSLTEQEKRGLQLFVTEFDPVNELRGADCFHCHGGNLFTNHRFANNGLDSEFIDEGRFLVSRDPLDRGKFKTPSLRNLTLTAPYMHDGRFTSIEEVIEHYASGVQPSETLDPNLAKHPKLGLELTPADKADLAAFLRTL